MGKKEYYQAWIETHRVTQSALLKFAGLFLIGIIAFGNLYSDRHDQLSLSITAILVVFLLIDLYWWMKIKKTIKHLQDELLIHLKEI